MLGEFESEEAGCHWESNPGYMACAASTSLIPRPLYDTLLRVWERDYASTCRLYHCVCQLNNHQPSQSSVCVLHRWYAMSQFHAWQLQKSLGTGLMECVQLPW